MAGILGSPHVACSPGTRKGKMQVLFLVLLGRAWPKQVTWTVKRGSRMPHTQEGIDISQTGQGIRALTLFCKLETIQEGRPGRATRVTLQ